MVKSNASPARPRAVLFLCTGNSARSVMAEAALRHWGGGRFQAHSAGSRPTGRVNPMTLDLLSRRGLPTEGFRSKSWDEFAAPGAPALDAIVTVCDNAAGETCPVWPGRPAAAHWGFPDPAAATGSDAERRRAFDRVFDMIEPRVRTLVALPVETMGTGELAAALAALAPEHAHG